VVRAPFLMETANKTPLPDEYVGDFKEFFRAYCCAFSYWMMHKAQISEQNFEPSEFIKKLFQRVQDPKSGLSVKNIYGIELTGKDASVDALEWRFLKWLAKG